MAKYNKKTALQVIVNAAKEYDVKLNNKHFLIVYQGGSRAVYNFTYNSMKEILEMFTFYGSGRAR